MSPEELGIPAVARLYYTGMSHRRYRRASTQKGPGEPLCFQSAAIYAIKRERATQSALMKKMAELLIAAKYDACKEFAAQIDAALTEYRRQQG